MWTDCLNHSDISSWEQQGTYSEEQRKQIPDRRH